MKRKKWSEAEEETLISHYSHLLSSGALSKLKTREKKFRPIADHLNSSHHLRDPLSFPFSWSWRDVSIKVQNMRHQYIGVKHKIWRPIDGDFNWSDGENHWENFLKYKEVFGDVDLDFNDNLSHRYTPRVQLDRYGVGCDIHCEGLEEDEETGDEEVKKRRMDLLGGELLQLRGAMVRREEGRREREFVREGDLVTREGDWREKERLEENRKRDEEEEKKAEESEEIELVRAKRELEIRLRLEREVEEERQWRRRREERREEEEFQWRERLMSMQIQHEKQLIQMQANACQNQLQVLGVMAHLMCQFFGSASDGLGALPPHILQHPGGLGDNGKPDSSSPSEFL